MPVQHSLKARLLRAAAVAAVAAFVGWLLQRLGLALPLAMGLAAVLFVIAAFVPRTGVALLGQLDLGFRAWRWRAEQGHHYSFGGVTISVKDDGRTMWIAGEDLRRVLRSEDADDVLAARHSGHWQRDGADMLWVRADAVAERLALAPGRMDPRTVRLRVWVERTVLFPAAERRRRGSAR